MVGPWNSMTWNPLEELSVTSTKDFDVSTVAGPSSRSVSLDGVAPIV